MLSILKFAILPFIILTVDASHDLRLRPTDPSFTRLESGENSDEVVNECCIRESKYLTLGQDLNGDEIRFDIGSCRQHCSNKVDTARPLKREEFDKYLKKYPKMNPIQIFLTLQNRHQSISSDETSILEGSSTSDIRGSCRFATCEPSSIRRHRHFSITGHFQDLEIVDTCTCLPIPDGCTRVSRNVRFHDSTPYEKTLDLGQCSGSCRDPDHSHCRAVRNKTVSLEGPNGFECVSIVEECQCVGSCYRTRQFQKVYDYSLLFEREKAKSNNSLESIGPARFEFDSESEPLTKVIDIGQCQGTCQAETGSRRCLLRSEVNNGTCISSLYGGHSHCVPSRLVSHFYIDRNGQRHSLVSVTSCGCR